MYDAADEAFDAWSCLRGDSCGNGVSARPADGARYSRRRGWLSDGRDAEDLGIRLLWPHSRRGTSSILHGRANIVDWTTPPVGKYVFGVAIALGGVPVPSIPTLNVLTPKRRRADALPRRDR